MAIRELTGRSPATLAKASRLSRQSRAGLLLAALVLIIPMVAAIGSSAARAQEDEVPPLRIGALLPFSGDLSEFGPGFFDVVQLAVQEINEAGGVNGQPIEVVRGDSATAPAQAVEEARRLIEVEGVNAIVGPAASGVVLQVVESVTGPEGVVLISPSATSPAITLANDNGFLFRTTISDAAQGVVVAELAGEQGYETACVMYINNAYGQGLNDSFVASFVDAGGTVTAEVPHEELQASYESELAACVADAPDAMVAISYPESGGVFLREALEAGDVATIIFTDGLRTTSIFDDLGWENFEGMYGTNPGAPETEAGIAFEEAFVTEYGEMAPVPFLREIYDAVYVIALAAEQAGSVDSTEIRDMIREVSNEPGEVVGPGIDGWQAAIDLIAAGEEINYEGASGSVEFDENGDIAVGSIAVWQVQDGEIVDLETREIDLTQ